MTSAVCLLVCLSASAFADEDIVYPPMSDSDFQAMLECGQHLAESDRGSKINDTDAKRVMRCMEGKGVNTDALFIDEEVDAAALAHSHAEDERVKQMGKVRTAADSPVAVPDKEALMNNLRGIKPASDAVAATEEQTDVPAAEAGTSAPRVFVPSRRNSEDSDGPKPVFLGR